MPCVLFYVIYYFLLLVIFACNFYFCLWFNPNKWYQSQVVFQLSSAGKSHGQVGVMADEGKVRVDRFNGKNFQLWKMQMEDYLYQNDLWKPLEGKTKNQGSMSNDE